MLLGSKIRKIRELKRLSQEELANLVGVSQTTIHNIESNKLLGVDIGLAIKISQTLDIPIQELLPESYQMFFNQNNSHSHIQNGTIFNQKEHSVESEALKLVVETQKELIENLKALISILQKEH
jgi:transcriptional regulator with XRE-family HTH domain